MTTKQAVLIDLCGITLAELEDKLTAAVNAGGWIVGFPTVSLDGQDIPTACLVRDAAVANEGDDNEDDEGDDDEG